jgi:serine/threonine-protein kinase
VRPRACARDPDRAARFEREAGLLAAINHPSIGAIYSTEEFDSVRCIVMELVPGETLAEIMGQGPMPLAEACAIAGQIADALEAAHAKGVIHRDLKPSNIKVTPEGRVKVLDLGLAKAMEPPPADDLSHSPRSLGDTAPSHPGTVEFMSPEQARGKEVDKRTDIWAFGCILYEMLSPRAFTGETATDVLSAILTKEPD